MAAIYQIIAYYYNYKFMKGIMTQGHKKTHKNKKKTKRNENMLEGAKDIKRTHTLTPTEERQFP